MKKNLAAILAIAMIGLTACRTENISLETTVAETTTATETTVETEAITTAEATTTTTAESVTTTISEAETTVEELNYNTAYVETAEKLFYALEGTTDSTTNKVKIYADDMNDDGVVEILCCKSTLGMGITDMYIFDVTTGKTNTLDMGQTIKGFFAYTTDEGTVHYLVRKSFWTSADRGNIDFYDITYTENQFKVEIPLHLEIAPWYDNRALVCDIKARTGCTFDIETQRYNMDNATELGVICQTEDLDWATKSIYGEDIEVVTKLIDEYVVKDMQLEYELELVAEVERLENGEYEKAWEEIAPAIQELYSIAGDNAENNVPAEFIELIEAQEPQKTKADFDEGNIFDENDYTVTMYYDDFNGDGIYEAFAAKSYWAYIAHAGVKYTEIWYTDGTECVFIDSQESMYEPYLQEKDGKKYISWITKVANNATVQLDTYVYTLTDTGEAKKCDCSLEGYAYGVEFEKGLVIVSEENTDIQLDVEWNGTDFVAVYGIQNSNLPTFISEK